MAEALSASGLRPQGPEPSPAAGDFAGAVAAIGRHVHNTKDKAIRYHEMRTQRAD